MAFSFSNLIVPEPGSLPNPVVGSEPKEPLQKPEVRSKEERALDLMAKSKNALSGINAPVKVELERKTENIEAPASLPVGEVKMPELKEVIEPKEPIVVKEMVTAAENITPVESKNIEAKSIHRMGEFYPEIKELMNLEDSLSQEKSMTPEGAMLAKTNIEALHEGDALREEFLNLAKKLNNLFSSNESKTKLNETLVAYQAYVKSIENDLSKETSNLKLAEDTKAKTLSELNHKIEELKKISKGEEVDKIKKLLNTFDKMEANKTLSEGNFSIKYPKAYELIESTKGVVSGKDTDMFLKTLNSENAGIVLLNMLVARFGNLN